MTASDRRHVGLSAFQTGAYPQRAAMDWAPDLAARVLSGDLLQSSIAAGQRRRAESLPPRHPFGIPRRCIGWGIRPSPSGLVGTRHFPRGRPIRMVARVAQPRERTRTPLIELVRRSWRLALRAMPKAQRVCRRRIVVDSINRCLPLEGAICRGDQSRVGQSRRDLYGRERRGPR